MTVIPTKVWAAMKKAFAPEKLHEIVCETCDNRGTMSCPNSYYCYATEDKPFWVPKREDKV